MTTFLLTVLIALLITAYLRQVIKQLDIVPIGDNMIHGPTIHAEKRRYQVWWDKCLRPVWWFVWGVALGWMVRGVVR